jgi:hypothetical protein
MNQSQSKKIQALSKLKLPQDARVLLSKIEKALQSNNQDAKAKANDALNNLFDKVKQIASKQQSEDKGVKVSQRNVVPKSADIDAPEQKEEIKELVDKVVDPLQDAIDADPSLKGFNKNATDVLKDSVRPALPRGMRISKKGWKNQYGASDGNRKYYESRENRSDRKAPITKKTKMPWLEDGGNIDSNEFQVVEVKNGIESVILTNQIMKDAKTYAMVKRHMGNDSDYMVKDGQGNIYYSSNPEMYAKGGYMADGGEMQNTSTLKLGDAVLYRDETHYLVKRNGEVGLVSYAQGAWGSGGRFIPLSKMFRSDLEENLTDMKRNKVNIPSYDELMQQPYGFMADGGYMKLDWEKADVGDNALVIAENKMGVIVKTYGRRFHLRFPDGSDKTYSAEELKFFFDEEYAKGGKLLTTRQRYVAELKGLSGLSQNALDDFIDENKLSDDEILNIVIGLGRKQIKTRDLVSAVVGDKNNEEYKKIMTFIKSDQAMRASKGGFMAKGGSIKKGDKVRSTMFEGVEGEVINKKDNMLFIRQEIDGNYNFDVLRVNEVEKMAKGGAIENQYEGRTPKDIWNNLSTDQKYHFIDDHAFEIEMVKDENYDSFSDKFPKSISPDFVRKSMRSEWKDLDEVVQNRFANHVRNGQYAYGGYMADGGAMGEELLGGQSNAQLKPSGYKLISQKGREIIVSDDGGETKERYVKNNGFSGYRLVYKGNDYEFTDSFEYGGFMAKGGDIVRNLNKNSYMDMFNFYLDNNETPVSKGNLIKMAYGNNTAGIDSAIPQSMVGDVDNTSFYVYDYQTNKFGELVDLRKKLQFSNVPVALTIVLDGKLIYGDDLMDELRNITFNRALNYVFKNKGISNFDIRPMSNGGMMANGGFMAEGGEIDANDLSKLKKGSKISMTFSSAIQKDNKVELMVQSKNMVNKGKRNEKEKITFINLKNPSGVKFYAYNEMDGYIGFAQGDLAIHNVKYTQIMAKGGKVESTTQLPYTLNKYFIKGTKTIEIPLTQITPSNARETGIENAEKFMKMAYDGKMERRKPISVYLISKGKYKISDGNSTFAVAKKNSWKTIYADVVKNPKSQSNGKNSIFSIAKEIRKDGEKWGDAIQRAKSMKK